MTLSGDSVAIFAEGSLEDQIVELAEYIARSLPEAERAAYVQSAQERVAGETPLDEDEGRKKDVVGWVVGEVKGLGEGSEREIEGFFNLVFAQVLQLWEGESEQLDSLLNAVSSASGDSTTKYRILSNVFNTLPRTSALRYKIYTTLLTLAAASSTLSVLQINRTDIERYLSTWDIPTAQKISFVRQLVSAHEEAGLQAEAYHYKLVLVRLEGSEDAALDAIATALRQPTTLDFDPLFKLPAVLSAKDAPLFALLRVFTSGGLSDLEGYKSSSVLGEFKLEYEVLERKMRLLTLGGLAFENVGLDVPYAKIAEVLGVEAGSVERWVIDAIRANLLVGKLAQTTQTLRVLRASPRSFSASEWSNLSARLTAARSALAGVRDTVTAARRRNEAVAQQAVQAALAKEEGKVGEVAA